MKFKFKVYLNKINLKASQSDKANEQFVQKNEQTRGS